MEIKRQGKEMRRERGGRGWKNGRDINGRKRERKGAKGKKTEREGEQKRK